VNTCTQVRLLGEKKQAKNEPEILPQSLNNTLKCYLTGENEDFKNIRRLK